MTNSQGYRLTRRTSALGIGILAGMGVLSLAVSPIRSEDSGTSRRSSKPVVEIAIPSIDHTYQDLKLLFDLARDEKSYQTFKDTLDEFLVGVDRTGRCGARLVMTKDRMSLVFSAPVKDDAAFHKFLTNLWDLDVKTAPAPSPQMQRQIPKSVQDKLHSQKLQSNERLLFGLTDGALHEEHGYAHLGKSLDAVRLAQGAPSTSSDKNASVTIDIHGDEEPSQRRTAFEKSKEDLLARPRREDFKSEAGFELAKASADFQLAKLELLIADASQVHLHYTLSRSKKAAELEGVVAAVDNTPLAKLVSRIGAQPDAFGGVSTDNANLVANFNVPTDPELGRQLKNVAEKAQAAAKNRIDSSSRLDASEKDDARELSSLISEIVSDVAGMDHFNGFLRSWADGEGKLTTLGAARVPHGEKYRERLRKFKHREPAEKKIAGVDVQKLRSERWRKDAPELFGGEGALYLATSDKAFWFAAGPQALERLEQAVEAAAHGSGTSTGASTGGSSRHPAIDVHANLRTLAMAWDAIGSRQAPDSAGSKQDSDSKAAKRPAKSAAKNESKPDRKSSNISSSAITDLQLHKIAGESAKEGEGQVTLSLVREGQKAKLAVTCDEGILRFIGKTLSTFTQQNLAD